MSKRKIPTGPTAGLRVSDTNAHGRYFCGVAARVGNGALVFKSSPVNSHAPADLHTKTGNKKLSRSLAYRLTSSLMVTLPQEPMVLGAVGAALFALDRARKQG